MFDHLYFPKKHVGSFRSPTHPSFDLQELEQALRLADVEAARSQRILSTAAWLKRQSDVLRAHKEVLTEEIPSNLSTKLCIAAINREFIITQKLLNEKIKSAKEKGGLAFDHLIHQPIDGPYPEMKNSQAGVIETAIDAAESWLFDFMRRNNDDVKNNEYQSITELTVGFNRFYSLQKIFNDMWNSALYLDYYIAEGEKNRVWMPFDPKLAEWTAAWKARDEAIFFSKTMQFAASWKKKSPRERRALSHRTVLDVNINRWDKSKIGIPACISSIPSRYLAEMAGFSRTYVEYFMNDKLPNTKNISLTDLNRAFHVIHDIADCLSTSVSGDLIQSWSCVANYSFEVEKNFLSSALKKCMSIDTDKACEIIEFLTFKPKLRGEKGHRGLWSAPIVQVPSTNGILLLLPSLAIGDPFRRVEAWMEKGGLDDSLKGTQRGLKFENTIRNNLHNAILGNNILVNSYSNNKSIPKSRNCDEEIDYMFSIGKKVFIAEIKFFLNPADAFEKYLHHEKLCAAASQAKRKADYLSKHRDIVKMHLGLTDHDLENGIFIPIVINNCSYGFGLDIDGCVVTDYRFLQLCLKDGAIVIGAAIDRFKNAQVDHVFDLYRSQIEAENNFPAILINPEVIMRYVRRVDWYQSAFPSADGRIAVQIPYLRDFEEEDLARYESAKEFLASL